MFIRNAWYVAAWADEISAEPLGRRICNDPVVLFRDAGGNLGALQDRCCHRGVPLAEGTVVERGLQCGYHGLTFDRHGACVHIPAQDMIPERARVRSYPVVEKDQFVWIWMGDAARADESLIVDFPYHNDQANWPHRHDMYPIACNNMLLVDNLMDLTHIGYVHGKTIGGSDPRYHVEAKMKTTRTKTGLKYVRWMLNSTPPPTYVKAVGFKGPVDRCHKFEFIAPGSILQWTGALDAGKGAYERGHIELGEGGFLIRLFHAITPETETTCFYFWSVAHGFRQDEPDVTALVFKEIGETFIEDKTIVEAQQRRLSEAGEDGLIDIATDDARLHMRRTVERLIAEDSAVPAAAE